MQIRTCPHTVGLLLTWRTDYWSTTLRVIDLTSDAKFRYLYTFSGHIHLVDSFPCYRLDVDVIFEAWGKLPGNWTAARRKTTLRNMWKSRSRWQLFNQVSLLFILFYTRWVYIPTADPLFVFWKLTEYAFSSTTLVSINLLKYLVGCHCKFYTIEALPG